MRWILLVVLVSLLGCTGPTALQPVAKADPDVPVSHIEKLLATLDDSPDILHSDYTPAVVKLIEIGEPAIEPTLPYLLSENEDTRLHAERVIDEAMMRMYGFVSGQGWSSPDHEQEFLQFHKTLWDGEAMGQKSVSESSDKFRRAYIERVKRWLGSRRT